MSNSLDGAKDDMIYKNSAESSADELDDSFGLKLFKSDDKELDFKGLAMECDQTLNFDTS